MMSRHHHCRPFFAFDGGGFFAIDTNVLGRGLVGRWLPGTVARHSFLLQQVGCFSYHLQKRSYYLLMIHPVRRPSAAIAACRSCAGILLLPKPTMFHKTLPLFFCKDKSPDPIPACSGDLKLF
jgi:hypothetical protein